MERQVVIIDSIKHKGNLTEIASVESRRMDSGDETHRRTQCTRQPLSVGHQHCSSGRDSHQQTEAEGKAVRQMSMHIKEYRKAQK